jgi:hypothetical protein
MVAPDAITSVTITYGNASASTAPVGIYAGQVTPSVAVGSFAAANYNISYASGNITVVGAVPQLSRPVNTGNGTFALRWKSSAGATGYNVERSNSLNMTASTLLATGNVTSLSINASASDVQFFRVRSISAAGNGTWSPIQVVQTVKVLPTKTSNIALAADPGAGNLTISGIFGASNEAGLTSSITAGNATTANFTLGIDPLKKVLPAVILQKGSWSSSNVPAFTQPITSGLIMSFIPANGNIQGTFNRTVNGAPVSTAFQGVMFASPLSFATGQPMIRGAGYFLSGNQTVPVQITVP